MKVLFITHESSRTGAPLMLLYFMEWVSEYRSDVQFDVLTLRPGVMDAEFQKHAGQYFKWFKKPKGSLKDQLVNTLQKKVLKKKSPNSEMLQKIREGAYDIIYANSVASLATAVSVKAGKARIVAHIHEMEVNLAKHAPNFKDLIPQVAHFIAASEAVKRDLLKYSAMAANAIAVIYEISKVGAQQGDKKEKDKFVVGGSGLVGWRKGTDVFIQVAQYLNTYYNEYEIHFVWLGKISAYQQLEIVSDLRKMKLSETVSFVGEKENPQTYYETFDVFLLTSREDPFPLVCIELGMLGKPMLCFENATGSSEMLTEEQGVIIPYLNIRGMAEKIIDLYNRPEERIKLGAANKKTFSRFTPAQICPQIMDSLDTLAGK